MKMMIEMIIKMMIEMMIEIIIRQEIICWILNNLSIDVLIWKKYVKLMI